MPPSRVVVTVFTHQAVIACQAVQVVVAGVTVDVVVQSVTGTIDVARTLQEQVFNVVGQGVVDYAANGIDTAVSITVFDNLVAFVVNKVNVITITTAHDVSVRTAVQVVIAVTALQVVFTALTVQGNHRCCHLAECRYRHHRKSRQHRRHRR